MTNARSNREIGLIKVVTFLLCLTPLGRLAWAAWTGDFGPEPIEFVQSWTGTWTFNLLLLTLCISPLRALTQLHWLLRLRRMLGLFTFFYATLHFLSFIGFEHIFSVDEISRDIFKRPFVMVGFGAFLLLIPLAATSNQWAIRRLGGRKWQELHRNIYLIGILGTVHYLWSSTLETIFWPLLYSAALGILLGWRVQERKRKAIPAIPSSTAKPIKFFKQRPD